MRNVSAITAGFSITDGVDNLDELKTTSICSFNPNGGTVPGNGYGVCITIRGGDPTNISSTWWIIQLAITTNNSMYVRQLSTSTTWKQISN